MKNIYGYNRSANDEPYIGMPVCLDGCLNIDIGSGGNSGGSGNNGGNGSGNHVGTISQMCTCLDNLPLAMAYVPMQRWGKLYDMSEGFYAGTIFSELDLRFIGGGGR